MNDIDDIFAAGVGYVDEQDEDEVVETDRSMTRGKNFETK